MATGGGAGGGATVAGVLDPASYRKPRGLERIFRGTSDGGFIGRGSVGRWERGPRMDGCGEGKVWGWDREGLKKF